MFGKAPAASSGISKKILIPSLLMLAIAALMLALASWAWFSMNREVVDDGMQLSAETPSNLVITTDSSAVATLAPVDSSFVAHQNVTKDKMLPCTHISSVVSGAAVASSNLEYVTNTGDVGITTGTAKSGATLSKATVLADANSYYYVDFTVYIASLQAEIENTKLHVTLQDVAPISSSAGELAQAVTIDFYVNDEYQTKLAVRDGAEGVDLILDGNTVPLNTEGSIKVTMRCYFDGALETASSGITYVRTTVCNTNRINLKVFFNAVDAG